MARRGPPKKKSGGATRQSAAPSRVQAKPSTRSKPSAPAAERDEPPSLAELKRARAKLDAALASLARRHRK